MNVQSKFVTKNRKRDRIIPDKIIVGYANWNQCDDLLIRAVENGVNVLIWFSINLEVDLNGKPIVTNGPNRECVEKIITQIEEMKLPTIHLISIGGWNSPHPDTSNSVQDVYESWIEWNDGLFDGFDWDIEGNDDMNSKYNHFTIPCLDLMGKMSQLARQNGYIIAMAPAESYLDPSTSCFDLDLTHIYPEWKELQPNFKYHGHNVYAYLLIKYGITKFIRSAENESDDGDDFINTFDFITIQLYEGYSHAEYNITIMKQQPSDYLVRFIQSLYDGWNIEFPSYLVENLNLSNNGYCSFENHQSTDTEVSLIHINIPKSQLVIGLANGWAGDGKFLLIYPDQISSAHSYLEGKGLQPRGYAFWNIKDEGLCSIMRPDEPVWMAQEINKFLFIR